MQKRILITLPRSDEVTEYLYTFSVPIIDFCKKKSITLNKLEGPDATKKNFEKIFSKINFKMILFNGHGSVNSITGHKEEPLIQASINEQLLKNKITYARSCWAVSGVGQQAMKENKFGCFIGYKLPFMFYADSTRATNPIKDHITRIFFDTSNLVPLAFLKNLTAKDAQENSRRAMLKAMNKALKKRDKDSYAIATALWNNYSCQVLLGNPEAKL